MKSNDIALRVDGLGKMYRLGHALPHAETFSGKVKNVVKSPFQWLLDQICEPNEDEILWALKDVSFEVKRGEVVGFIGPNGAGKTTLLKLLSRITEPSTGVAEIHGRIAALLEVGTGMHPELTGRENIYMNGTVLGMKKREIDKKFDEIVEFSGISKFLDTQVKRYSSGMRVRLGFAIAAHLEPEILVVDEVLAVGDADFQAKCLGKMQDVASGGRTVLFVSHNMAAIENLCSRAYLLQSGVMAFEGPTSDVVNRYFENQKQRMSQPVSARVDRKGNGAIRFSDVSFLNGNGHRVETIASGQHLSIAISYAGQQAAKLKGLDIHITFYTTRGQVMFTCSNVGSGYIFDMLPSNSRLVCRIDRLPLSPGEYTFNLYATVLGEVADWIKNAGTLSVVNGDFHGSGRVFSHKEGFLVEQAWHHDCYADQYELTGGNE